MEDEIEERLRLDENGKPYAVCPHCHKPINYVIISTREDAEYEVSPDKWGLLNYKERFRDKNMGFNDKYRCPYCNEVLARDAYEADELFFEPIPKPKYKHKLKA